MLEFFGLLLVSSLHVLDLGSVFLLDDSKFRAGLLLLLRLLLELVFIELNLLHQQSFLFLVLRLMKNLFPLKLLKPVFLSHQLIPKALFILLELSLQMLNLVSHLVFIVHLLSLENLDRLLHDLLFSHNLSLLILKVLNFLKISLFVSELLLLDHI